LEIIEMKKAYLALPNTLRRLLGNHEMLHTSETYKKEANGLQKYKKKRPSKLRDTSRRDQCTSPPLQFSPAK
jgi:hypothetical protein